MGKRTNNEHNHPQFSSLVYRLRLRSSTRKLRSRKITPTPPKQQQQKKLSEHRFRISSNISIMSTTDAEFSAIQPSSPADSGSSTIGIHQQPTILTIESTDVKKDSIESAQAMPIETRELRNRKITPTPPKQQQQKKLSEHRSRISSNMSIMSTTDAEFSAIQPSSPADSGSSTIGIYQQPTILTIESTVVKQNIIDSAQSIPIETLLQVMPTQPPMIPHELHLNVADYSRAMKDIPSIFQCTVFTRPPSPCNPLFHSLFRTKFIAGIEHSKLPHTGIRFQFSVEHGNNISMNANQLLNNFKKLLKLKFPLKLTDLTQLILYKDEKPKIIEKNSILKNRFLRIVESKTIKHSNVHNEKSSKPIEEPKVPEISTKRVQIGQKVLNLIPSNNLTNASISLDVSETQHAFRRLYKLSSIEKLNFTPAIAAPSQINSVAVSKPNSNPRDYKETNISSIRSVSIPVCIPSFPGFENVKFEPYIPAPCKLPPSHVVLKEVRPKRKARPKATSSIPSPNRVKIKSADKAINMVQIPVIVQFTTQKLSKSLNFSKVLHSSIVSPSLDTTGSSRQPGIGQCQISSSGTNNCNNFPSEIPRFSKEKHFGLKSFGQTSVPTMKPSSSNRSPYQIPMNKFFLKENQSPIPTMKPSCSNRSIIQIPMNNFFLKEQQSPIPTMKPNSSNRSPIQIPMNQSVLKEQQSPIPTTKPSYSKSFPFQIPMNERFLKEEPLELDANELKKEVGEKYNLGSEEVSFEDLLNIPNEEFLESNVEMSDVFP